MTVGPGIATIGGPAANGVVTPKILTGQPVEMSGPTHGEPTTVWQRVSNHGGRTMKLRWTTALLTLFIALPLVSPIDIPDAQAATGGYWDLKKVEKNKAQENSPENWVADLTETGIDVQVRYRDLELNWKATWEAPPARLAPGEEVEIPITLSGTGVGGGQILASYTILSDGRSLSLHTDCQIPAGGTTSECLNWVPDQSADKNFKHSNGVVSTTFVYDVPAQGESFDIGIASLNCGTACVIVWPYEWKEGSSPASTTTSTTMPSVATPVDSSDQPATVPVDCEVNGQVRVGAHKLRDFTVALHTANDDFTIGTDDDGELSFGRLADLFDVLEGPVQLELIPNEYHDKTPRFNIYWDGRQPTLRTRPFATDDPQLCDLDIDLSAPSSDLFNGDASALRRWNEIGLTFRDLSDSVKLADDLGFSLSKGLPLPVLLACEGNELIGFQARCPGEPGEAFYVGPRPGRSVGRPYIAIAPPTDAMTLHGDVILHEFGHAFLADLLLAGNPNTSVSPHNHGGYWANWDSSDALVEGFATFWATIVKREVREEYNWSTYRYRTGTVIDLEDNTFAWIGGNGEEIALAGMLVDLIDGEDDRLVAPELIELEVNLTDELTFDGDHYWCGTVYNPSEFVARDVVIELLSDTDPTHAQGWLVRNVTSVGETSVRQPASSSIRGRSTVEFCASIYGDRDEIFVEAHDAARAEDDEVELESAQFLIRLIKGANNPDGGGYPETVSDIYDALTKLALGNAEVQKLIDDLFVAHGQFADMAATATRQQFDGVQQGEAIGRTDHFAGSCVFRLDGDEPPVCNAFGETPEMSPRRNVGLVDYQWARLPEALPSGVVITVRIDAENETGNSWTYSTHPDADGNFQIAVPQSDPGAIVNVYATNPYRSEPGWVVIDTFTAAEWNDHDPAPTGAPIREYDVDLSSLSFSASEGSSGVRLLIIAALAALLGAGAMFGIRRRRQGEADDQPA